MHTGPGTDGNKAGYFYNRANVSNVITVDEARSADLTLVQDGVEPFEGTFGLVPGTSTTGQVSYTADHRLIKESPVQKVPAMKALR